jgi:hypothetical protein
MSASTARLGRFEVWLTGLGPYQSLSALAVPLLIVEPLKLLALFIIGAGHWLLGGGLLAGMYAASLLVVDRIFGVVKPKLLVLNWFATIWALWIRLRGRLTMVYRRHLRR